MAKKVIDGKCPHCGSNTGYTVTHTERVARDFDFSNEAVGISQETLSGGKQARCKDCGNIIDVGRKEFG